MNVEVERDALLAVVRAVQDVVESRNTIPVLGNLLIDADGARLTVTGTNLDLQASATCEATGSMSITVDRSKFAAAIESFKPGRVKIALEGGLMILSLGRGRRQLATLPAADFPKRQPLEAKVRFDVPASSLGRILDSCHIAQSTEETRYYLNGVFLHVTSDKLIGVATDGHRVVRAEKPLPEGAAGMPDSIVPTKAVTHLRKLVAKREGTVSIAIQGGINRAIEIRIGDHWLSAKLLDATYPDYQRVIPPAGKHELVGARDAFVEPSAAVASVINAEGDKVKVRGIAIEVGANGVEMSARDTTGASASEPLDVDATGGAIRFGLNQKYLASIAGVFAESGKLTMSLDSPTAPMRVTGDKDPDLVAVIMPMRA